MRVSRGRRVPCARRGCARRGSTAAAPRPRSSHRRAQGGAGPGRRVRRRGGCPSTPGSVAHNVNFDYGFISQEFTRLDRRFHFPKFCTCAGMRRHFPGHRSYSLGRICSIYEISLEHHHRALCDAEAASKLLNLINRRGRSSQSAMLHRSVLRSAAMLVDHGVEFLTLGLVHVHEDAPARIALRRDQLLLLQNRRTWLLAPV